MSGSRTGPRPPAPTIERAAPWLLAIDTATATAVAALGDRSGGLVEERAWRAGYRHGEELLGRIDELLASRGETAEALAAIVVGTGPGAFTGLRVGLATAKGLAHGLGLALVGIPSASGLIDASMAAGAAPPIALLLPAGPVDRVLVVASSTEILPGGRDPELPAGTTLVAVDLHGRAPEAAVELGRRAVAGLGAALLRIGASRLALGETDDIAVVVPEYVTLPRGVHEQAGEVAWSRDRR